MDAALLDRADEAREAITERMEDLFDDFCAQYRANVIVPFCDRHGFRFSCVNGFWGFLTVGGHVLSDPEGLEHEWRAATGQLRFENDVSRGPVTYRNPETWREEKPEFFEVFQRIDAQLSTEIHGFTVGYGIEDYNSPRYERAKGSRGTNR